MSKRRIEWTNFPVERQTIDMSTGEVVATKMVNFQLAPPREGSCPVCARYPAHPEEFPHDADSMYYQYAFYGEHGRWPTWKDAMAHCTPEMQKLWEDALKAKGRWRE